MKVKELIQQLIQHNLEAEVILGVDTEGESFSHIDNCFGGNGETSLILYREAKLLDSDYDDIMNGLLKE